MAQKRRAQNSGKPSAKELKWDEHNLDLVEAEKPPGGRMVIDEPKTPFHAPEHSEEDEEGEDDQGAGALDVEEATQKLETLEQKKSFEQKRRLHYHVQGGGRGGCCALGV